jgi:hypothetical protein
MVNYCNNAQVFLLFIRNIQNIIDCLMKLEKV